MSRTKVTSVFNTDKAGNPAGGVTSTSHYLQIRWQSGVVGSCGHNGVFLEDVVEAAIQRLRFFQGTKFACRENALAITKLEEANMWLEQRTKNRVEQGVEDTYEVHAS